MQKPTIVLLLTLAVVAAAVAYTQLRPQPPAAKPAVAAAASDAVPAAAPPPASPAASPSPIPVQAPAGPRMVEAGTDQNERVMKDLRDMDTKFMSEPVSPRWSAAQESMIATALSPETLTAAKIPAPASYEATCRSNTCRIKLNYKSYADQQLGQLNLLGAISPTLPQAIMGELHGADGSSQLFVYASPGRYGPALPEPHHH